MIVAKPLISVVGLSKRYGQRRVLEDVHLTVGRSETVALIGPSGGGKSTLLRSINALEPLGRRRDPRRAVHAASRHGDAAATAPRYGRCAACWA